MLLSCYKNLTVFGVMKLKMADLENISEFIFPGSTLGFLADLKADQGPTRAYQGPWSLAGGVKFLSAEGPRRLLSGLG